MSILETPFWPWNVVVGAGAIKKTADYIADLTDGKAKKVIMVTDPGLRNLPKAQEVMQIVKDAGYELEVFSDVEGNPTDTNVLNLVALMRSYKPDAVVYYGGGSATDCGKVANVVYTHGGDDPQYYSSANDGPKKIKKNTLLPAVSIATTAGTGTETSTSAVITDTTRHQKFSVYSTYLLPDISLLDPEVTVSLPAKLTAYTGMDALVHNIEAYFSDVPFLPIRGVALQGVKTIYSNLRTAYIFPDNLEARENMLVGSCCGAIAFNIIGLGVVHATAHQLSSVAGLHHGLSCALMMPACMRWNLPSCMQELADCAQAMGAKTDNMSLREAAEKSIDMFVMMMKDLDMPLSLKEAGVTMDMIDEMADKAFTDRNSLNNPRKNNPAPHVINRETLKQLYLAAYEGY
ncbi:MAG: iron-containing alcohol dehydrogenase [Lachnospiraceae bacterium]|nr:iron-containing alcohol dehydrogenase [Lachnospiraceae bacterium]